MFILLKPFSAFCVCAICLTKIYKKKYMMPSKIHNAMTKIKSNTSYIYILSSDGKALLSE
jgi:hypothetical protein